MVLKGGSFDPYDPPLDPPLKIDLSSMCCSRFALCTLFMIVVILSGILLSRLVIAMISIRECFVPRFTSRTLQQATGRLTSVGTHCALVQPGFERRLSQVYTAIPQPNKRRIPSDGRYSLKG